MGALIHLVKKESLVLVRDWHALLLLFAMPVLFILVMSLALRDRFAAQQGAALTYFLKNLDSHALSADVEVKVLAEESFRRLSSDEGAEALRERVARDEAHFLVLIPQGFGAAIDLPEPLAVQVLSGPGVDPATAKLFEAGVRGAVTRIYTERSIEKLQSSFPPRPGAPGPGGDSAPGSAAPQVNLDAADALVRRATAGRGAAEEFAAVPTAVQQSVPAWLVFAMFFIAIPLSTTWVQERHQGTFARLRAMGLSRGALLFGKLPAALALTVPSFDAARARIARPSLLAHSALPRRKARAPPGVARARRRARRTMRAAAVRTPHCWRDLAV